MLKVENYLSPSCHLLEAGAEGVLCSSVADLSPEPNESFGKLEDFIW